MRLLKGMLLGVAALGLTAPSRAAQFPEARIFIEYNSTDNDLGFHVFLDAENWTAATIKNPAGLTIYDVKAQGAFGALGLSEMFFEGAEPSLDEVPLETLLGLMPEGRYTFTGVTVAGSRLTSRPTLSHAVPAGPSVSTEVNGETVIIRWEPVTGPPEGFPNRAIVITGYQVIVDTFQVTLPASSTSVAVPEELIQSLDPGPHTFEVLAIEASGNQSITSGFFVID